MPCPSRRLPGASAWSTSGPHYRPLINWLPLPPTRWSVPAVLVGGRALRVPPGWASGPPFPRPAAAGVSGLWGIGGKCRDGAYPTSAAGSSSTSWPLTITTIRGWSQVGASGGPGSVGLPGQRPGRLDLPPLPTTLALKVQQAAGAAGREAPTTGTAPSGGPNVRRRGGPDGRGLCLLRHGRPAVGSRGGVVGSAPQRWPSGRPTGNGTRGGGRVVDQLDGVEPCRAAA